MDSKPITRDQVEPEPRKASDQSAADGQLGFGWVEPARTKARKKDRERPGDVPGWKSGSP